MPASSRDIDGHIIRYQRTRKRGPRSQLAVLRRSLPKNRRTLPDAAAGESTASASAPFKVYPPSSVQICEKHSLIKVVQATSANSNCMPVIENKDKSKNKKSFVSFFVCNIRCVLKNLTELCVQLRRHRPHVVMLQETWLDASVEHVDIEGYKIVSRRDRHASSNRGGILTLAREDFNNLAFIKKCEDEERSWHYLNLGMETVLLGNWYRPGASCHDGFANLQSELAVLAAQASGTIFAGDLNIHHRRWLYHSNDNTLVRADMKILCDSFGLLQLVREPTRGPYLLDLFITDLAECHVFVLPSIADHKTVLAEVPLPEIQQKSICRYSWKLDEANWNDLENELADLDWSNLARGTAEDSLTYFLEILGLCLQKHIPYRKTLHKKKNHPWLNEQCERAILQKNNAEGTSDFQEMQGRCRRTLADEYQRYLETLRDKISSLKRGSKQWWKLNRQLLNKKPRLEASPH